MKKVSFDAKNRVMIASPQNEKRFFINSLYEVST
jgi:hypothetical protein